MQTADRLLKLLRLAYRNRSREEARMALHNAGRIAGPTISPLIEQAVISDEPDGLIACTIVILCTPARAQAARRVKPAPAPWVYTPRESAFVNGWSIERVSVGTGFRGRTTHGYSVVYSITYATLEEAERAIGERYAIGAGPTS